MVGGVALSCAGLAAQETPAQVADAAVVGSEWEEYLRYLQTLGAAAPYPWSLRALSPREIDRVLPVDSLHPWRARQPQPADSAAGPAVRWISPRVDVAHNTAFPHGINDGAVWAGKGLTTAVRGGVSLRYGPLSATLLPVVFRAENEAFPLAGGTGSGRDPYADPMGVGIDLPQRFGEGAYHRIDPGQSTIRVDFPAVTIGVSTANQAWGPATTHPLLLGNNAPGFAHAFVGTGSPLNVGVGRLHGRFMLGELEQSAHSPAPDSIRDRLMSGMVVVFVPRGLPGLELGGARLLTTRRYPGVLKHHLRGVFNPLLKSQSIERDDDSVEGTADQLASVFARWVAPGSGFEFYGEYARDDHSWDMRDFLLEPDHAAGYMVGFRKAWRMADTRILAVRGEVLNTKASHLRRLRNPGIFYAGSGIPQGHTHRGQVLGSAAAFGGSGSVLAADLYHPGGRWTATWSRMYLHGLGNGPVPLVPDVVQSFGVDGLVFRSRWDLRAGVEGAFRDDPYRPGESFNLRSSLGVALKL